ncbi:spore germination protein GerW family protein [Salipaludibacillus neizhouensis]|nr:spore germination protein GerW family protein [Salipaludibacillus neizhouensis]
MNEKQKYSKVEHETSDNEHTKMSYESPVRPLFEKFSKGRDVTLIYGDPIELGDMKILPVAKVNYSFGGGGGKSLGTEKAPPSEGEGGGGHVSITPVGVFHISPTETIFKPVKDVKKTIGMMMLGILTLGFVWFSREIK